MHELHSGSTDTKHCAEVAYPRSTNVRNDELVLTAKAVAVCQVQTHGMHCISSWQGSRPGLPTCSSWGQAVQYLDPHKVQKVRLNCSQHSGVTIFVADSCSPSGSMQHTL